MKNIVNLLNKFNRFVAINVTKILGTMWCAWFLLIMVLIPLGFPQLLTIIMFISSSVLQLIFLPIIMVGTALTAETSDKQNKEMHDKVMEEFEQNEKLMDSLKETVEEVKTMHSELHNLVLKIHVAANDKPTDITISESEMVQPDPALIPVPKKRKTPPLRIISEAGAESTVEDFEKKQVLKRKKK